jgi:hypothetical protein
VKFSQFVPFLLGLQNLVGRVPTFCRYALVPLCWLFFDEFFLLLVLVLVLLLVSASGADIDDETLLPDYNNIA